MFKKFQIILGLLCLSHFLSSCESDPYSSDGQIPEFIFEGALIINEGNFGIGNASLSYYDANRDIIYNNVFENANNGAKLGDVANSAYLKDSLAYIVVNNTDKIEVINASNFDTVKTISLPGGSSPRNLSISTSGLLYVTCLYQDKVMVIDADAGNILESISVGGNPEGILIVQGFAYVTNSGFGVGNTVSVIDLSTDQVIHTVKVGDNPQWVEVDAMDRIHVLCSGAYNDFSDLEDDSPGGVWVIDPKNYSVVDSLIMAKGSHPSELSLSIHEKGYFLYQQAVLEYSTETLQVLRATLIKKVNSIPYHIRVNDISSEIYICDAKDFISPGELYIYDLNGNEKNHHTVGIIPGYICFININKAP